MMKERTKKLLAEVEAAHDFQARPPQGNAVRDVCRVCGLWRYYVEGEYSFSTPFGAEVLLIDAGRCGQEACR